MNHIPLRINYPIGKPSFTAAFEVEEEAFEADLTYLKSFLEPAAEVSLLLVVHQ